MPLDNYIWFNHCSQGRIDKENHQSINYWSIKQSINYRYRSIKQAIISTLKQASNQSINYQSMQSMQKTMILTTLTDLE